MLAPILLTMLLFSASGNAQTEAVALIGKLAAPFIRRSCSSL